MIIIKPRIYRDRLINFKAEDFQALLESFLELLHAAIQEGRNDEIIKKNFITIYEGVRDNNFEINLEPFQKTYEDLHKK